MIKFLNIYKQDLNIQNKNINDIKKLYLRIILYWVKKLMNLKKNFQSTRS